MRERKEEWVRKEKEKNRPQQTDRNWNRRRRKARVTMKKKRGVREQRALSKRTTKQKG